MVHWPSIGISKLRLKNFKSIRSADIHFSPLTVLLGANSVGKSSVMQSLVLLAANLRESRGGSFILNNHLVKLGSFKDLLTQGSADAVELEILFAQTGASVKVELEGSGPDGSTAKVNTFSVDNGRISKVKIERRLGNIFEISGTFESTRTHPDEWEELRPEEIQDHIDQEHFPPGYLVEIKDSESISEFVDHRKRNATSQYRSDASSWLLIEVDLKPAILSMIENQRADSLLFMKLISEESLKDSNITFRESGVPIPLLEVLEAALDGNSNDPVGFLGDLQKRLSLTPKEEILDDGQVRRTIGIDLYNEEFGYSSETCEEIVEAFLSTANVPLFVAEPAHPDNDEYHDGVEKILNEWDSRPNSSEITAVAKRASEVIKYLGPLRLDNQAPQNTSAFSDPISPVGLNGDHTGQLIQQLAAMRYDSYETFPLPKGARKSASSHGLIALQEWAKYLGLGNQIETLESGISGSRIILDGKGLHQVGTGVSQLLPVLVMCLTSKKGDVLLIEQPELHLHPGAQQKLADFFIAVAKSGRQIIVETHSEYLVTRLRRSVVVEGENPGLMGLLFVEQSPHGAVVREAKMDMTGSFDYWPEGFFAQTEDDILMILEASLRLSED